MNQGNLPSPEYLLEHSQLVILQQKVAESDGEWPSDDIDFMDPKIDHLILREAVSRQGRTCDTAISVMSLVAPNRRAFWLTASADMGIACDGLDGFLSNVWSVSDLRQYRDAYRLIGAGPYVAGLDAILNLTHGHPKGDECLGSLPRDVVRSIEQQSPPWAFAATEFRLRFAARNAEWFFRRP